MNSPIKLCTESGALFTSFARWLLRILSLQVVLQAPLVEELSSPLLATFFARECLAAGSAVPIWYLVAPRRMLTILASCALRLAAFSVFAGASARWKATLVVAVIDVTLGALPRASCFLARVAFGASAGLTNEVELWVVPWTGFHVCPEVPIFAEAALPFP
jgi:hypothetical protein